jgi:hypothetical protein
VSAPGEKALLLVEHKLELPVHEVAERDVVLARIELKRALKLAVRAARGAGGEEAVDQFGTGSECRCVCLHCRLHTWKQPLTLLVCTTHNAPPTGRQARLSFCAASLAATMESCLVGIVPVAHQFNLRSLY